MSAVILPFPIKKPVRTEELFERLQAQLREFREREEQRRRTAEQLNHAAAYGKRRERHDNDGPEAA